MDRLDKIESERRSIPGNDGRLQAPFPFWLTPRNDPRAIAIIVPTPGAFQHKLYCCSVVIKCNLLRHQRNKT
jgi:hypothetical protein